MKPQKSGKRHPLLFYRRSMGRLGKATLVLGLVLAALWGWEMMSGQLIFESQADFWLLVGTLATLGFSLFAFMSRYMAYVQARSNHLRLVTPFFQLRISFRRLRSVHPASVQQLFPLKDSRWAQRRFLTPFYGKTAVVLELYSYPLSPRLLRFFLPSEMFLRQSTGLVLVIPDWMAFSTELDSLQGSWLQSQGRQKAPPGTWRR